MRKSVTLLIFLATVAAAEPVPRRSTGFKHARLSGSDTECLTRPSRRIHGHASTKSRALAVLAGSRGGGGQGDPSTAPSIGWPIFVSFLYFLSIAMTAPAMPAFCNQLFDLDGADKVNSRGVNMYGLFTSVDQLFTFFFVGFWGSLSDRIGRKPLVVLSSTGVAAGWFTVALSSSLPLLLLGRALDGVTSCMLPLTQSMVRDLTSDPQDLGKNLGRLQGLSVGFAFIFGAMFGGVLTQRKGPRLVFKIAGAVAAGAAVLSALLLPESLPALRAAGGAGGGAVGGNLKRPTSPNTASAETAEAAGTAGGSPGASLGNPAAALRLLGRSRRSVGLALTFLCFWCGLNGIQINLFNYVQHKFGWNKVQGVQLQALSGLILAAGNAAGPALLLPRLGQRGTIRFGMAMMACCLAGLSVASSGVAFRLLVCGASGATLCLPVLMAALAQCFAADEGGACLSALETANTLNRVAAYGGMSRVLGWSIGEGRPPAMAGLFFGLGAAAVALGLLIFEATATAHAEGAAAQHAAVQPTAAPPTEKEA